MAGKTFTIGDAVEVVAEPTTVITENLWEPADYLKPGVNQGWHWCRSDVLGQVLVPSRRIRMSRSKS